MKTRTILLPALAILTLAACANSYDENAQIRRPAEELFAEATQALEDEIYLEATRLYEEVERQHPYSQLATRAQIMAAYSSYQDERYDDAILALDRFIQLHPGNARVDYAYYLTALCYYDQISDVRRDQDMTSQALEAFDALLARFPNSEYVRDAKLKRDLTLDHLAGKEMEIGRYYLTRGHVNAAIRRFTAVVQDYQTTTHTAEALYRLTEGYLKLGVKPEAYRVAQVLGHNYPGNAWYQRAYNLLDDEARARLNADRGFVDRTIEAVFTPE